MVRRQKKMKDQIIQSNPIKTPKTNQTPINLVFKHSRQGRQKIRTTNKTRNGSLPHRGIKIRIERIRAMPERNNKNEWIEPFIGESRKTPIIKLEVDKKNIEATIDTGATRIMATSRMAQRLWGPNYKQNLQQYPNRAVEDAQGNEVVVEGFKISKIKLGKHLETEYPIVVYQAEHEELLIGYTYLVDHELVIYCGKGIGTSPLKETVRRLNFKQEPMQCKPVTDEEIPAKTMKAVKLKVETPENWTKEQKMSLIGQPIIVHSEDIEKVDLDQLTCPYTYDILELEYIVHALVDNSNNNEPLIIRKNEIIAHAELVEEAVPNEQIKRLIKEGTYSFEEQTQKGEYKLEKEETPERFSYIDKINIKTEDKGIEFFCKKLLRNTESFWSKHTFDLGLFDRKARITLNSTTPVWDKFRPIHPDKQTAAEEIISQLERHKIISRANSPFCSQPVWVYKKAADKRGKDAVAGEPDTHAPRALRLALDYRRVNKLISSQCHWPNPNIREILFKLKKAKCISILDLTNSFWNIELDEASKPIFAFQTSNAQFVWNRLPQGCTPSSSLMAEAVTDTVMGAGIADCTSTYVDNIIITSDSVTQHKRDLYRTIEGFRKRGWKAVPEKSHLFIQDQCRLFGFNIDLKNQTIGVDPKKVEAILQLPAPHNQKSARSLCGTVNYYSDLLPGLAPLMAPIYETTKDSGFHWTQECQSNFEQIKKELAKLPVVHMPDFQDEMHVFTDAAMSRYLGYVITQYRPNLGKYVPLTFGSHKFNKHEQSMSQPECELYAIIYALMNESLLLAFSKVVIHTDCRSLTYLFRFSKICSKLNRWQLILASFNTEIMFEPSTSLGIQIADQLSRRPGYNPINRRPKIEEIEQLPQIHMEEGTRMTMCKIKEEIMKALETLPPLLPSTIKFMEEKYTPKGMDIQTMECNKDILMKMAKDPLIEEFKQEYRPQFVYTPEHLAFKQDISPPGRLINLILEEAPHLSLKALKYHQLSDPYFGPKMNKMINEGKPVEDYIIKNGILLKQSQNENMEIESYQVCVPRSLVPQLITKFHYSVFSGHPDLKKLMSNLKKRFFIKNLKQEAQMVLKSCQICSLNKSFTNMHQPFGAKIKVTGVRQLYALDVCTVDYKAKEIDPNLKTSFLIITDAWSLYSLAIPINADATAKEILEKFSLHIIQPFGLPKLGICTDGAKNFSNTLSNTFSAVLGIQQFRISPYNARSNCAERINRAILSAMRMAMQQFELEPEVFKNLLNWTVLAWNTSVLSHINFSPYELFLSTPHSPAAFTSFVTIQEAEKSYNDFIAGIIKSQTIVENLVNKRFQATRDKRYAEKAKHSRNTEYSPGMQVMIKLREDHTQRAHKLRPRYSGPYKIIKEFENNVEVIPWRPNERTKFIDKYHNESKRIPKFEKFIIGKDRIKPVRNMTYYYDDNLARHFYQTFWDQIRDVQPIKEVERFMEPRLETKIQDTNPKRPTSLIQPHQIGIQTNNVMKPQRDNTNIEANLTTKKKKTKPLSSISSAHNGKSSQPLPQQNVEQEENNQVSSSESTDDYQSPDTDNDDDDDNNDDDNNNEQSHEASDDTNSDHNDDDNQGPEQLQIETHLPLTNNPGTGNQTSYQENNPTPGPSHKNTGARPKQQKQPQTRDKIKPYVKNTEPRRTIPKIKERFELAPSIRFKGSNKAIMLTGSNQKKKSEPESIKSKKSTKRMDPAVKEALTSKMSFFKDHRFEGLRDNHPNVEENIENITDALEENYRQIEGNIEEIISEPTDNA